jgi:tetratricopeptide (TPR) repeat protein
MGVTLLRLRRRDEARDALKKAITIYQHSTDEDFRRRNGKNYYKAIYQLGKVYLAKKRYGHAEACFSKVLNEDCRSYNQKGFVRFRLAKCFYLQADYQRALDQLADIDDNVAHKEFTHDLRGRCHFKLGDAAAAIKAFDQALKRKADGYIFRNRALAHILAKNLEAAKRDLDVAMRKDRLGKHKTLLILGEVAMLQNHLSEAIAYFEKAIAYKYKKYDAIYREAHMALGEAYEMQGNRDKAAVHFGQAAELINRPDHIREAVPGHD